MSLEIDRIKSAERILIPKGEANASCIDFFQETAGIEVPTFQGEKLVSNSEGRQFFKVRAKDVPMYLFGQYGDVGIIGTDVIVESEHSMDRLVSPESMARFCLLGLAAEVEDIRDRLSVGADMSPEPINVATSNPKLLRMSAAELGLNIQVDHSLTPQGSVEVIPWMTDTQVVADIVSTGRTARDNGLTEVQELTGIYPEIVACQASSI